MKKIKKVKIDRDSINEFKLQELNFNEKEYAKKKIKRKQVSSMIGFFNLPLAFSGVICLFFIVALYPPTIVYVILPSIFLILFIGIIFNSLSETEKDIEELKEKYKL